MLHYIFFLVLVSVSSIASAQCLDEDVIQGQYLVRLKKTGVQASSKMTALSEKTSGNFSKALLGKNLHFKTLFNETSVFSQALSVQYLSGGPPTTYVVSGIGADDLKFLNSHSDVDTVETDCRDHLFQAVPWTNDPQFSQQWGLQKIHAVDAWALNTGSKDIIIAVSDSGVDYTHEDLKDNMWVNTKEIPANGIDDDNNGCIDDIYGCDLADHDGNPMPLASNVELEHGTHVAGIIGAVGNNSVGVSGVSQHIRLMAAKGFPDSTSAQTNESDLLQTIYYAVNNGARVINCSWGRTGSPTQAETDAFKYAADHGVIVVVAAGNSNQDSSTFSPASLPTVITVAATDSTDQIATFSNWGAKIDLAAPGGKGYDNSGNMLDGIFSTLPMANGKYGNLIGTSMAAPFVTGLAGLILSQNPKLTPAEVLKAMRDGGDKIHVTTTGNNLQFDYIRINAFGSLKLVKAAMTVTTGGGGGGNQNTFNSGPLNAIPSAVQSAFKGGGCGMISTQASSSLPSSDVGHLVMDWVLLFAPIAVFAFLRKQNYLVLKKNA